MFKEKSLRIMAPFLVLLILMMSATMAADRYVNVNTGTDDLTGGRGDTPGNPWKTIEYAVTNSNPNDNVNVAAGDYKTSTTGLILINKTLRLLGPQADVDPRPSAGTTRTPGDSSTEAIINSQGALATILEIAAHGVEINGFEITDATGDMIESNSGDWTTATLKCCIIHDAGDEGVQLRDVWHSTIEYNYVYDIAQDGINVSQGSWDTRIQFNEMTTCNSENSVIYVYNSYGAIYINDNYIHNCTASNGIKVYENYDWPEAEPFYILNNRIENNDFNGTKYAIEGNAIQLYKPFKMANANSSIIVQGNLIKNNDGNGNDARQAGHGIYFHQATELTTNYLPLDIINNHIQENQGWGIMLVTASSTRDPSISYVYSNHNTLYNNPLGEFNNTTSVTADAKLNYWGFSAGPAFGDLSGPVTTDTQALFTPRYVKLDTGGGTVSLEALLNDRYTLHSVTIPGLNQSSYFQMRAPEDRHGLNNAVEILLEPGTTLTGKATVKLEFTIPDDEITPYTWEQMRLAKWNGSSWEVISDPTNVSNFGVENTVECEVDSFSIFGVYPDPATVPVELSIFSLE